MTNKSISQLSAGGAVAGTDLIPDVQTVGVGPVKVTADQLKTFMSASPTLVTPNLGVATGTSIALGGAAIGSNAFAINGNETLVTPSTTTASYQYWNNGSVNVAAVAGYSDDATSGHLGLYTTTSSTLTERVRVDSLGRVIIGYSSGITIAGTSAGLQNYSVSGYQSNARFSNDANGTVLSLAKSRSATVGTNTIVQSGDQLGALAFCGADGSTAYDAAASVSSYVDGSPSTTSMPGRLLFSTTASGATSATERMRIDSAGRIGFGAAANTYQYMTISPTITGQAFEDTITIGSKLASDVTSAGRGIQSQITTGAATAYTNIIHFYVNPAALFAGSSLTNQFAFHADSSITTAANNFGFYSNIASSSGRWNFYAYGTAANYFAGDVRIGSNAAGASKLVVNDSSIQLNTAKTPASASDTGTTGQICWDSGYIYVCVATNTWKRAAIATW